MSILTPEPTQSSIPSPQSSILSTQHLFPAGYLTLLLGLPGTAKSLLALDLAARCTRRAPMPPAPMTSPDEPLGPESRPPTAIICSREDPDDLIKLRLAAAGGTGADRGLYDIRSHLSLTHIDPPPITRPRDPWEADPERYTLGQPTLLASLYREVHILKHNPRLLILDPLPAFLENLDCSNPASIRNHLIPLIQFAEANRIALIGITHLAKPRHGQSLLDSILGSRVYSALARSVLLITPDTLTHNPHRRLVIPLKNNLIPITHGLSFTIQSWYMSPEDPTCPPLPYLQWDQSPITTHPLLPPTQNSDLRSQKSELRGQQSALTPQDSPDQLALARRFILETLADGPLLSADLFKEGSGLGLSRRTIMRARKDLQVQALKQPGTRRWLAYLPDPDYAI